MHPKTQWLTGFNSIHNAIQAAKRTHKCLFYAEDLDDAAQRTLLKACYKHSIPTQNLLSPRALQKKAQQPDDYIQAKAALLTGELPVGDARKLESLEPGLWLALHHPQNPQNLGALLRTAYFLGAKGVLLTQKQTAPLNSAVSRASAGALEVVPIWMIPGSMPLWLESINSKCPIHLIGTSCGFSSENVVVKSLQDIITEQSKKPQAYARILVMGNEHSGLEMGTKGEKWNSIIHDWISIRGGDSFVDSLNVSVAAGIILHELQAISTRQEAKRKDEAASLEKNFGKII
jgi:tRNA G18 (ribose-2'-O)-methylase SpoU